MTAVYRKFVFVCDDYLLSKIRGYSYQARSFADALLQFEKEITSSYKKRVCFVWQPVSDYVFKYIIVFDGNHMDKPVTVEVYEE